ncbi:glycoside hydrolase family 16 protein, partial [Hypholoma sublateritium FD-334 SS-4]
LLSAFALDLLKDYSGASFFDEWDFFGGWDNLTLGDVNWVDKSNATSKKLAFINGAGNAILKVDNTTNVVWQNKRDSVRVTTRKVYPIGTIWIADIVHMPFGCSVWPALWTKGPLWPADGEIDIIEGINLMQNNQIALHTQPGCNHSSPAPANQRGLSDQLDCGVEAGCTVRETAPNSFGSGFNSAGGGVYATHFDASSVWFWSRQNIPASIRRLSPTSALASLDDWGPPSANFPSGTNCNIANHFGSQSLVIDITLCGTWAGAPTIYSPQCSAQGKTGKCYDDNVIGTGDKYNDAYFEIKYVRAY